MKTGDSMLGVLEVFCTVKSSPVVSVSMALVSVSLDRFLFWLFFGRGDVDVEERLKLVDDAR